MLHIPKEGFTINVTTWPFQKLKYDEALGFYDQKPVPGILIDGVKI